MYVIKSFADNGKLLEFLNKKPSLKPISAWSTPVAVYVLLEKLGGESD